MPSQHQRTACDLNVAVVQVHPQAVTPTNSLTSTRLIHRFRLKIHQWHPEFTSDLQWRVYLIRRGLKVPIKIPLHVAILNSVHLLIPAILLHGAILNKILHTPQLSHSPAHMEDMADPEVQLRQRRKLVQPVSPNLLPVDDAQLHQKILVLVMVFTPKQEIKLVPAHKGAQLNHLKKWIPAMICTLVYTAAHKGVPLHHQKKWTPFMVCILVSVAAHKGVPLHHQKKWTPSMVCTQVFALVSTSQLL